MNNGVNISERILILAPTGQDAVNAAQVMHLAGITAAICHNPGELLEKLKEGAGAALLAEEALSQETANKLIEHLSSQPKWSDLPLLIITSAKQAAQAGQELLNYFDPHGNVTLIERPLRPISLVSAMRVALRARRRQYQLHEFLEEQERTKAGLQIALEAGKLGHWDLDLITLKATRSLQHDKIFGYENPVPDWTYDIFLQHVHPEDRAAVDEAFHHSFTAGNWSFECRIIRADGRPAWIWARGQILKAADGKPGRALGVVADITDQKQAEEKLEQTVAERTAKLQETISELEAFSYSVSHDLRGPLRAMQGYSQFLLEDYSDKIDATGRDYIRRVVKAAERLDRLIQDILTYSRVTRREIDSKPINLEKLIQEVIHGYPALQAPNADIVIKSPLLKIIGHEGSVTQCISNLLGNAVKFVEKNRQPQVVIWTEPRDGMVRICFRDNGIGIAAEYQNRIFQIFEQAHFSPDYEGTGIGLSIVRKAAQRMGGEVGVESEPGKGSTFWIELPRA